MFGRKLFCEVKMEIQILRKTSISMIYNINGLELGKIVVAEAEDRVYNIYYKYKDKYFSLFGS